MKYIDSEKLIAEIERGLSAHDKVDHLEAQEVGKAWNRGYRRALESILEIITSLQQEQQEVKLEKEIDKYFSKWMQGASDEGCFNSDSQLVSIYDCQRIARYFYNLGRNARKED